MKRLHKLVIASFLGPFVMTFFIVLFLLLMQFLWRYIDELVGKGLGFEIIGEFLMYAGSGLVPLALPLAVLLSSLMTFGNMGEYYELTAIKASGISLQRVLIPIVLLVMLLSVGSFFFANNVVPYTNLKMRALRSDVQNLNPEVTITEGVFFKGINNYSIRVGKKDPINSKLYDIKIYDHSGARGNPDVTIADSGIMKMTEDKRYMLITLWSGFKYTEDLETKRKKNKTYPHRELKFKEQNILIGVTGFELSRSDEKVFKGSYQMLNVSQLQTAIDSIKRNINNKKQEFSGKISNIDFFNINKKGVGNIYGYENTYIENPKTKRDSFLRMEKRIIEQNRIADLKKVARKASLEPRNDLNNIDTFKAAQSKSDSVIYKKPKLREIKNFDSLFASLSTYDKKGIIRAANTNASSYEFEIFNTLPLIDHETRILRRHEIEWHRKFTLSLACLIFLFIGAPLGAIIRKGGLGLPAVISTLLFILYYIISLMGQKFVEENLITSFQGMWLSSFILIIAGVFLTYQAANDSAILNIDTYLNWLREKAGLKKRILLEQKTHILGKFELIEISRSDLQSNFLNIKSIAQKSVDSLKNDTTWIDLAKKSYNNSGYSYLLEFGVHYNSFIDQIILSQWFRIQYFQKRLSEFPLINGRITSDIFTKKTYRLLALIIFPIGLVRIIHLKIKIRRLLNSLRQVIDLSSGMINLLNSSALKIEDKTI